jgi:hypothetical protein
MLAQKETPALSAPVQPVTYVPVRARGVARNTLVREAAPGSPEYAFAGAGGNNKCVRRFYMQWGQNPAVIWNAAKDFLGLSSIRIDPNMGKKFVSRTIPCDNPNFLLAPPPPTVDPSFYYAESMPQVAGDVPAYQDSNKVGTFDEAKLTVVYSTMPYGILTDGELAAATGTYADESSLLRYVSFEEKTGGYYQTIPLAGALKWVPDGKDMVMKKGVILPEGDLHITWHQIPIAAYPNTAIAACVKASNNAPLGNPNSLVGAIPTGQLVCLWPQKQLVKLTDGTWGLNVHYFFKRYPQGANSFYRFQAAPGVSGFQPATFTGAAGGAQLFPPADFNALFQPEP